MRMSIVWRDVIVGLAVLVCVCSLLDALLTLLHLEGGGCEANPLMHVALAHGTTLFVVLKLSITCVAAWFLRSINNSRWPIAACTGLSSAMGCYSPITSRSSCASCDRGAP